MRPSAICWCRGSKAGLMLREDANQGVCRWSVQSSPSKCTRGYEHDQGRKRVPDNVPNGSKCDLVRSHAVLQINVSQKDRNAAVNEPHTMAALSIIDLAGSERASATKNRGRD
jgi:kinesin family protein 18/19